MASWLVWFVRDEIEVGVELIDTVGPINKWLCQEQEVISPPSGDFTNQTGKVVPMAQPSWILDEFDIDKVREGQRGSGNMIDNIGSFPLGRFSWVVARKI